MLLARGFELVREGARAERCEVGDDPVRIEHASARPAHDVSHLVLGHRRLDDHQKVVEHHGDADARAAARAGWGVVLTLCVRGSCEYFPPLAATFARQEARKKMKEVQHKKTGKNPGQAPRFQMTIFQP